MAEDAKADERRVKGEERRSGYRGGEGTRRWGWQQSVWGEAGAEFLGTFVLIMFGDGIVATCVAGLSQSGRGELGFNSGDWILITFAWGFAVMLGVYVAGGVSGAHLNPAVTFAQALRRGFPWKKVPTYIFAQVFGAFVAAAVVYFNYRFAIGSFEHVEKITRGSPNSVGTYSIFATFPAEYFTSWFGPFMDQVIGTALLVACIFAVIDEYNAPAKSNLAPFIIGLIVVVIGMSFGVNAGYAINPARDLGPRLFAWAQGWGKIAFPGDYGNVNTYFWIPIVGPFVGAGIGAFIYDLLIRNVLIARGVKPDPEMVEEAQTTIEED
jgi:glycerol uptake facilitator protein